jgi:hypothetical protein
VLSRQENRCVLTYVWYMSHSKDLILLFGVSETVLRNLTAYHMTRLIWGASHVPAKCLPLIQSGGSNISLDLSSPPRSFVFYPDDGPPWIDTWGGGAALLSLTKLHCQPNLGYPLSLPPFSSFWVDVENSGNPVASNDLSTPYDSLPWSREMPQLAVVDKTLMT